MRLALISNPTSNHGRHRSAAETTRRALIARGYEVLPAAQDGSDGLGALLEERGVDALVVVGGDGMVHQGLNLVATTGVPMGIVATGTGNDIARHFGLPARDVLAATDVIDAALTGQGRVLGCDAIRVTGAYGQHWCMAVVGAGIDAVVNRRANNLRWPHGEARYTVAVVPEIVRMRPYGYRVTTDAGTWEGPAMLLAAANTSFIGGGMTLAPSAEVTDGLLDVLRLDPVTRPGLVGLFLRIFQGTHVEHPAVHIERSRAVTIEALPDKEAGLHTPPRPYADGEAIAPLPLRLEAVPEAVRLLLPR
ncbi:MAG: diacylglycerol kinase family protein [Actinomyces sp.]|uniref:diacylglycerol/lipid kinase family protein n=1 Tax=Actinomyces sp. TaxID=29317 RepID=UPI0026DC7CA6|nr:diacylglycerol kinase family protein [Actinomyces sp.]MDO4243309.1 diacylglycerol kinase family protein [Actinomyces sp.]